MLFGQQVFTLKKNYTPRDVMKYNVVDVRILVEILKAVTDFEFVSVRSPVASF